MKNTNTARTSVIFKKFPLSLPHTHVVKGFIKKTSFGFGILSWNNLDRLG